jgi:uncharacterized protein (DUF1786 family)
MLFFFQLAESELCVEDFEQAVPIFDLFVEFIELNPCRSIFGVYFDDVSEVFDRLLIAIECVTKQRTNREVEVFLARVRVAQFDLPAEDVEEIFPG